MRGWDGRRGMRDGKDLGPEERSWMLESVRTVRLLVGWWAGWSGERGLRGLVCVRGALVRGRW